jgi:SAM-dependent methyltransferase
MYFGLSGKVSGEKMAHEKSEFKPTERFSARVDNYIKYRPTYPLAILSFLKEKLNFASTALIADIGSGTGISSELFLKNGNRVFGIEPNNDMRGAAENLLKDYPGFISINGTAEATGLANASIDFIVAGQAFHWFDEMKAKTEFSRILKPDGYVVLIWNSRNLDTSPFLIAYEKLLQQFSIDYREINHKNVDMQILNRFFEPGYQEVKFENNQMFDLEGLQGRLLSSSYVPMEGHENYNEMLKQLNDIFNKYQENGLVNFEYTTEVFYGKV